MFRKLNNRGNVAVIASVVLVAVVIVVAVIIGGHHSKPTASSSNACVDKSFSSGDSGHCVSDIQNLANDQAYGIDGQLYIKVTGTYDTPTTSAVKTFQKNFSLPQTGKITPTDWKQLCRTQDSSATLSSAAKDAGCS